MLINKHNKMADHNADLNPSILLLHSLPSFQHHCTTAAALSMFTSCAYFDMSSPLHPLPKQHTLVMASPLINKTQAKALLHGRSHYLVSPDTLSQLLQCPF